MRTFKTVTVPATPETTKEVEDKTLCDLCGIAIREHGYDVDSVTMEWEVGARYPEGADVECTGFDVCGDCFKNKVVPWMREQGATPRIEDRGW
jgi:hypothetical protein